MTITPLGIGIVVSAGTIIGLDINDASLRGQVVFGVLNGWFAAALAWSVSQAWLLFRGAGR